MIPDGFRSALLRSCGRCYSSPCRCLLRPFRVPVPPRSPWLRHDLDAGGLSVGEWRDLIGQIRRWLYWSAGYAAARGEVPGPDVDERDAALEAAAVLGPSRGAPALVRWYVETVPHYRDGGARAGWDALRRKAYRDGLEREEWPSMAPTVAEKLIHGMRY